MAKMKNSGIEWIGEIPEVWSVIRLKHSAWLKGRIGWQGLRSDEFREEGPYLITGTDFDNGIVNWNTCVHITESRFREAPEIHIHEDDLLITKDGTIGKIAIAKNCPEKVSLNSGVFIVRNTGKYKYVSKFLYYIIQSNEFTLWFDLGNAGNSTIKHLNQEMFYNFQFALPPLETQKCIADFLDSKCSKIDSLKNDIQKQIETLEQYKKSVITEAVTKGINPNTKMKDSGVEWIGKIPEHWEVSNPKWHFVQRKDRAKLGLKQYTASQKYGVISQEEYMERTGAKIVTVAKDFDILKLVCPGDFVIHMRSFQGGLEYSEAYGSISSAYVMLIPQKTIANPRYYRWFFKSPVYIDALSSTSNLIRDGQAMRYANFVQIPILIPTADEQTDIADYLDKKCSSIDSIITTKKQQLEKLEEYKKSLIFVYVTGKKEVV